jgi:hypothetical protein
VSEALARVEEQRGLIARLRTMDLDTTTAEALLCSLLKCLSTLRRHKEQLERESTARVEHFLVSEPLGERRWDR